MAKGMPKSLRELLKQNINSCFFCGDYFEDKRLNPEISMKTKRRARRISPIILRRWTGTSITLECMFCKMRFSFTWVSFFNGWLYSNITTDDKQNIELVKLVNTYKAFLNKLKAAEKRKRESERASKYGLPPLL